MLQRPDNNLSGELVGSPLSLSPEPITAGRVSIDRRTSLYSLGATIDERLTHQLSFPGETRDQVLSQIRCKEPVPPQRIYRKVPIELDTIYIKAIERHPDCRYQTAEQFAQDLRAYVNRYAISTRRLDLFGRGEKYVRRSPLATKLVCFVLLPR